LKLATSFFMALLTAALRSPPHLVGDLDEAT
jgi:hypothetical protein